MHLQVEIPPGLCNSLAQSSNCEADQEIENLRKLSGNYMSSLSPTGHSFHWAQIEPKYTTFNLILHRLI